MGFAPVQEAGCGRADSRWAYLKGRRPRRCAGRAVKKGLVYMHRPLIYIAPFVGAGTT